MSPFPCKSHTPCVADDEPDTRNGPARVDSSLCPPVTAETKKGIKRTFTTCVEL